MAIPIYQPVTFGDTSGNLAGHVHAGSETISTPPGDRLTLVGDANALQGNAVGGNDTLTSANLLDSNTVIGDAFTVTGNARGGNDTIDTNSVRGVSYVLGDAMTLSGNAHGGDDSVSSNAFLSAFAYGDAYTMTGHAKGGDDVVTGSSTRVVTELYGDAQTLNGSAVGGNDTIVGVAGNPTKMYGDGAQLLGHSTGGNDTLISGSNANDQMWGDAATVSAQAHRGADIFEFSPSNGQDSIMDFQSGIDHIQLAGFGFGSFADFSGDISYTATGAMITFDASDSIFVAGVTQLNASDFILT